MDILVICTLNQLFIKCSLKLGFRNNKVVSGKTPFIVICPFHNFHSIYLNIGFWQGSFVWKCCAFNRSTLNLKMVFQFFKKVLTAQKNHFKVKVLKTFKISRDCHIKTCWSLKWRAVLKIFSTAFQRNLRSFCCLQNKTITKKQFAVKFVERSSRPCSAYLIISLFKHLYSW